MHRLQQDQTCKAAVDQIEGHVQIGELPYQALQACANGFHIACDCVALEADAREAAEGLHFCIGEFANKSHLCQVQLHKTACIA